MYKFVISLCAFLLFSANALADTEVGRLPDGRAYRIDEQGYQLVDYVAELELKIEDLQTEIIALNNELKLNSKQNSDQGGFVEKSINTPTAKTIVPEPAVRVVTKEVQIPGDCKAEEQQISEYQSKLDFASSQEAILLKKLSELEAKNRTILAQLNDQRELLLENNSQEDQEKAKLAALKQNIDILNSQLLEKEQVIADLKAENQYQAKLMMAQKAEQKEAEERAHAEKLASLTEKLQVAERKLIMLNDGKNEVENKLQLALNKNSELEAKLEAAESAQPDLDYTEQPATEAVTEQVTETVVADHTPRSARPTYVTGSSQREKAFSHLKEKLAGDLAKLKNMIAERQSLSGKYQSVKSSNNFQISLKPLSTKSGFTVSKLEAALQTAAKFSDLGKVQKNTYELSRNVQSDIAILQRMLR